MSGPTRHELSLEIEALEERVAPGLLLGFGASASVSASVGVAIAAPCNPCYAPPPCYPPPCYTPCYRPC